MWKKLPEDAHVWTRYCRAHQCLFLSWGGTEYVVLLFSLNPMFSYNTSLITQCPHFSNILHNINIDYNHLGVKQTSYMPFSACPFWDKDQTRNVGHMSPWPRDPKINRGHVLVMTNLPVKYEDFVIYSINKDNQREPF